MFITSSFGGGGITTYAHEVINCYGKDHELSVVVGCQGDYKITSNNVHIHHLESDDLSIKNGRTLLDIVYKDTPDVIINSNSKLASLILPYIPDDITYVSVSHSLKYTEAEIAGLNAKYADTLIALSEYGKKYLEKRFSIRDAKKVISISNFSEPLEVDGQHTRCAYRDFQIVFSGGSSPVKSPDLVARILLILLKSDLKFQFYWVGNTNMPLNRFSYLKDIKQLFPKDSRLHFTGRVSRREAQMLSSTADVYIFPSRREGCPMSLLEALSGGTIPFVADYPNANREIVKEMGIGQVLSNHHPEEFVRQISILMESGKDNSQLYAEISAFYRNHYTYEVWSRKMTDLLEYKVRTHNKRVSTFSVLRFVFDRAILQFNIARSHWMALFTETLPTFFSLNRLYIKQKMK